jgi:hypothetical protein
MKGVHVGVVLALIAGESRPLTKKELKTLLATAKT